MLKDITLGQYFPGKSPIHLLDPRTKLILLVVYIVALFMAGGWISYGLLFLALVAVIRISTIPVKSILKGMKPLVMILVFTGVLNLFFTQDGEVLLDIGFVTVTTGGLTRAIFMTVILQFCIILTAPAILIFSLLSYSLF